MASFDRQSVRELLEVLGDRLTGEWLLIGGAFVALFVDERRTTEDVDLVGMEGTQEERFALLDAATDLGLPIEALNSAADYFLRKIDGWREQTRIVHRGKACTIHGPNATLLCLLKIGRLSERDLEDLLAMLNAIDGSGESLDVPRVLEAMDQLPTTEDEHLGARRKRLRTVLSARA